MYRILSKAGNRDNDDDSSSVEGDETETGKREAVSKNQMTPLYTFDLHLNFLQGTRIVQEMLVWPQHQVNKYVAPSVDEAPPPNIVVSLSLSKSSDVLPQQQ